MNPLRAIPESVRMVAYVLYAAAGPILIWTASRGWTGDAEYALWVALGTALGLTAAANTRGGADAAGDQ